MGSKQPVLFIGHGSPMNALEENAFTQNLRKLGSELTEPKAILVISAHWETNGSQVLSSSSPKTIHDFYGFPKELFAMEYPAPGAPQLAKAIHEISSSIKTTETWGFDHGTWSVLTHLFPKANIPVTQLSIDRYKSNEEHLELGKKLSTLRDEGILIIGSGNIVHNLSILQWGTKNHGEPWAEEFDEIIKNSLENHNENILIEFDKLGEVAQLAVPTREHYIPLLYSYGASSSTDKLSYPYEGFEMGSLSMRSVMWSV